jgi:putative ABC transport system ATP-binding protein
MVNDPALILADEPTGALDSRTSDEILSLFEDLHRDVGRVHLINPKTIICAPRAVPRANIFNALTEK